jgi:Kef-type K+ transport system membrane component KefB
MSNADLTSALFLLLLLVGLAQLLGWLFVKMRQPKVVGEILAGVVLGNAVVGRWPLAAHFIDHARKQGDVQDFVYWL